jgi:hypothetical protein
VTAPKRRPGSGSGSNSGSNAKPTSKPTSGQTSASGSSGSLRGSGSSSGGTSQRRRAGPKGRPSSAGRTAPPQKARPAARQPEPEREEPTAPIVVQPPAAVSFARGLVAVGTSPVILVTAFLSVVALWFAFTAVSSGVVPSSAALVQMLLLPPGHSFVDVGLLAGSRATPVAGVAFGVGLILFRAMFASFVIAACDVALRGGASPGQTIRQAWGRALRAFWVVLALEGGYVVVTLFVGTLPLILGSQAAPLVSSAWLIGGLYFLIYCQIAAVVDLAAPRDTVTWSVRAARLPGREHAILVLSYVVVSLLLPAFADRISGLQATPSISAWIYALTAAFLNMSLLAAFTWRWNVLAEPVKAGAGARPRRAPAASGAGRGGRATPSRGRR